MPVELVEHQVSTAVPIATMTATAQRRHVLGSAEECPRPTACTLVTINRRHQGLHAVLCLLEVWPPGRAAGKMTADSSSPFASGSCARRRAADLPEGCHRGA